MCRCMLTVMLLLPTILWASPQFSVGADFELNAWKGEGQAENFNSSAAQLGLHGKAVFNPFIVGIKFLGGQFDFQGVNPSLQNIGNEDGQFSRNEVDMIVGYQSTAWMTVFADAKMIEYMSSFENETVTASGLGIGIQASHQLYSQTYLFGHGAVLSGQSKRNSDTGNSKMFGWSVGLLYTLSPSTTATLSIKQQAVQYRISGQSQDHAVVGMVLGMQYHF